MLLPRLLCSKSYTVKFRGPEQCSPTGIFGLAPLLRHPCYLHVLGLNSCAWAMNAIIMWIIHEVVNDDLGIVNDE